MSPSLRTRFFLITWPLVVVAVGAVALTFGWWARVELTRFEEMGADEDATALGVLAQRAALRWDEVKGPSAGDVLSDLVSGLEVVGGAALVDVGGRMVVSSDLRLRIEGGPDGPAGIAAFRRLVEDGPMVREEDLRVGGAPIVVGSDTVGFAYILPDPQQDGPVVVQGPATRGLTRTLWFTVLAASAAAAVAALVLAGPLVHQMRRLSEAAESVQRGGLSTRVPEGPDDELGRLERSFNAMAGALERAEVHKRNVVGDVAHELRTPLTNVRGLLEAVQDGLRQPDAATIGALLEQTSLLEALVEELQELSLAESGQLPLDVEPLDLAVEVEAVLAGLEATRPEVSLRCPRDMAHALGDRRRVRQVLTNLVQNALTYTPDGGEVRVDVTNEDGWVRVDVSDDGPGIPTEHLDLVWERFHRVDASRQRSSGGMGLGLAVVRQLVLAMNGSVAVNSEVGVGTTFSVRLPGAG